MQIAAEANRKFLSTTAAPAARDWDALLAYQVDLGFAQELEFLLSLRVWQDASHVLDAGCGNGYYMARLQEFFPEKSYRGVDISPELVALAASRYPNVVITNGDIVDFEPEQRFDLVIMRFVVQHLKDFRAVLRAADRLLRPAGRLLIIESDLNKSSHFPALPAFTDMLLSFARVCADQGAVKYRLLSNADRFVRDSDARWSIERQDCVTSPRVGPFHESKLLAIYQLWIDLCERSNMFKFDFEGVRNELERWAVSPATFSNVALRLLVMRRD